MKYQHYSKAFKETILKKLSQSDLSVSKFAQQEGINLSTLYSWQKQFKVTGIKDSKEITPEKWSAEEKFAAVLETATLSEIEVSEYCRTKGLYPAQIKDWKQACIEGNANNKKAIAPTQNKTDKKRIKQLEKELNRKEKALAETAALLVLRKKFNAYWGGRRGQLILLDNRQSYEELINEAQARHATSRNSGTPVTLIRSPTQRMGDALNALRP